MLADGATLPTTSPNIPSPIPLAPTQPAPLPTRLSARTPHLLLKRLCLQPGDQAAMPAWTHQVDYLAQLLKIVVISQRF